MPKVSDAIASRTRGPQQHVVGGTLALINAVRREVGEDELDRLPLGSRVNPDYNCPIARGLTALILPLERRISFHHPWHAAAATKLWKEPFTDPLLLSVGMPEVIYQFAIAFRQGALPDFEERNRPALPKADE